VFSRDDRSDAGLDDRNIARELARVAAHVKGLDVRAENFRPDIPSGLSESRKFPQVLDVSSA
jgi:hypothetical protein